LHDGEFRQFLLGTGCLAAVVGQVGYPLFTRPLSGWSKSSGESAGTFAAW
jgi:hypothetical protein